MMNLLDVNYFCKKVPSELFTWTLNPFIPNSPSLYPLKTSQTCKVFLCFQSVGKGCIGNEWVNKSLLFGKNILHQVSLIHKRK